MKVLKTVALCMLVATRVLSQDVVGTRANIGTNHIVVGTWATIAGGNTNYNGGDESAIGGGAHNVILSAEHATISGGLGNAILANTAEYTVIGGGENNTNNAEWAFIGGGIKNIIGTNATWSVIGGGFSNQVFSRWGTIGGGLTNFLNDETGVIAGGWGNRDVGHYSVIGGGAYNQIFDNGTGRSGEGDFIGGGSYNTNTGTFSVVGSGSGNKIYQGPYHVIAGGWDNYIAGGYGVTIGGGQFNVAGDPSGDLGEGDIIGGGLNNVNLSIEGGTIAGGSFNTLTSDTIYNTIAGGRSNAITNGYYGSIGGGYGNLVSADLATAPGGASAHARTYGQLAYASGAFANVGDAQASQYVLRRSTSNSSTTELFLDGSSARMSIPSGGTWTFDVQVVARSGNNSAGFRFEGVVENVGGTASLLAAPNTLTSRDVGSWGANISVSGDALIIQVNGDNTTVRWVATVRTTEVRN